MLIQGLCGPPRWYFWAFLTPKADSPDLKTYYKFLSKWKEKIYWLILIYTSANTIWQLSLPVLLPTTTATIFSSSSYSFSSFFSASSSSSSSSSSLHFLPVHILPLTLLLPTIVWYLSFSICHHNFLTFFPVGESHFLWLTKSLIEKIANRSKYNIFCTVFTFQQNSLYSF